MLTLRDFSVVREDQAGGRPPVRPGSLEASIEVRAPKTDQEAGRLPLKPPFPMLREARLLMLLTGRGRGRSVKAPPGAVPEPIPGPFTVPMPVMLERSTPDTVPLVHVTPAHVEVQGSVPGSQLDREGGLPKAILTANRALLS